jgi:DNA-binding GntR family transcriptional regulator
MENKHKLKTEEAYNLLKEKIVNFELRPGQLLSEKEILSNFGFGRTPVRDALLKIEKDGLIEIIPRKGAIIKSLSIKDITEIFEIRKALEGFAASLAVNGLDLMELNEFENFYLNEIPHDKLENQKETLDVGIKFHDFIIKSSKNDRIKNILSSLRVQLRICRMYLLNQNPNNQPSRIIQSVKEHLSIIDALKKKDEVSAEIRMREHICNAEAYTLNLTYTLKLR